MGRCERHRARAASPLAARASLYWDGTRRRGDGRVRRIARARGRASVSGTVAANRPLGCDPRPEFPRSSSLRRARRALRFSRERDERRLPAGRRPMAAGDVGSHRSRAHPPCRTATRALCLGVGHREAGDGQRIGRAVIGACRPRGGRRNRRVVRQPVHPRLRPRSTRCPGHRVRRPVRCSRRRPAPPRERHATHTGARLLSSRTCRLAVS